jgi:hypothetical protein
MSPPADREFSTRALAKALGLDRRLVAKYVKRGMPRDPTGASQWRLQYIRTRRRDGKRPHMSTSANPRDRIERETTIVEFEDPIDSVPGGLDATLERLRRLERSAALTLQRLLKEGRVGEAASVRAQHASVLKSLFDAEVKVMKLAEQRGELVKLERAVGMITTAMSEAVVLLRQLPSLGRDEAEKQKLTVFMTAVLQAMRTGAEAGFKNGAASAIAQGG